MHKIKKETYERPDCNLRVIRFAQSLLAFSTEGNTIQDVDLEEWEDEL